MLLNKNKRTTENHFISSESVAKKLENPANSYRKQSKRPLYMIWLKDENGHLIAHWTTQG